jgi:signal peptidase I, bacterial type
MDRIYTYLENRLSAYLTRKKAIKAYEKSKGRTFWGEVWSWIDALLFAIVVVILINQYLFQLFVIPSPSMVHTLEEKDRVIVNKLSYGLEAWPGGPKLFSSSRPVQREQIITFYNPEYLSKGPVFDVLAQFIYMGTFTLVNIDKNPDGSMAERLFVKRAIGLSGERVNFEEGNLKIKKSGSTGYVDEETFREENGFVSGPQRSVEESEYDALKAWGQLYGYQEAGVKMVPNVLIQRYSKNTATYPMDMYEFDRNSSYAKVTADPSNMDYRAALGRYDAGIYIPEGRVLPLGDNRDNSRDGRYFGPVNEAKVNGRVVGRFWPLNRISVLVGK